jgi:hypothetical protein
VESVAERPDNAYSDHTANGHFAKVHYIITHRFAVPVFMLYLSRFSPVLFGSICQICEVHSKKEMGGVSDKDFFHPSKGNL